MKKARDDPTARRIERLKQLRSVMGYSGHGGQTLWAAFLGIDMQRWSNIERGAQLSREVALTIVEKCPGMSLDWLYLGKADGLPRMWLERLGLMRGPSSFIEDPIKPLRVRSRGKLVAA